MINHKRLSCVCLSIYLHIYCYTSLNLNNFLWTTLTTSPPKSISLLIVALTLILLVCFPFDFEPFDFELVLVSLPFEPPVRKSLLSLILFFVVYATTNKYAIHPYSHYGLFHFSLFIKCCICSWTQSSACIWIISLSAFLTQVSFTWFGDFHKIIPHLYSSILYE